MNVIAIGGSVLLDHKRIFRKELIRSYVDIINENREKFDGIVVGGGTIASEYINVGQSMGLGDEKLDELGIQVTRMNAKLIGELLPFDTVIPSNIGELNKNESEDSLPVLGGTEVGQTTDAVATSVADVLNSRRVIFCSDVDGIYDTRGCSSLENADKLKSISIEKLREIIADGDEQPGRSIPVDRKATQTMAVKKIEGTVIDGLQPINLRNLIDGKTVGTKIHYNR